MSPAKLSFPLRGSLKTASASSDTKSGPRSTAGGRLAYATWTLTLPVGEHVQALVPQAAPGPVASVGRVLGNRTTLYKYLDPRAVHGAHGERSTRDVRDLRTRAAKGTVVYHAEIKATARGCEVKTALVENWLMFHYYEAEVAGGTVGGTMGYRMGQR